MERQNLFTTTILLISISILSSCHISQKIDKYVGDQFNNQLPKTEKKKNTDITVKSSIPFATTDISSTIHKAKVLPLIIYWQWDDRHTTTLNPAIAVNYFNKAINLQANKGLNQKLNGQQLELTVEQAPSAFSTVDKGHAIWLIYAIHWSKYFLEPDSKDLIVSYKVLLNGSEMKTGKITVKSLAQNQGIRYFQSWKSAASEFLGQYNLDMTTMAKTFVSSLVQEL